MLKFRLVQPDYFISETPYKDTERFMYEIFK